MTAALNRLDVGHDAPRGVAAMVCTALLLALAMAFVSAINRDPSQWRGPPDEHGHRSAAKYYIDHWLPPRVGDPATLESYSRDYGYSYLNELDLAYPFAGKFAALLSPVVPDVDRGLRLFNVALLALLAAVCLRRPAAWPVFVPLVLTPQAWYVFSYFNGDALPLCLSVLVAYQVAYPESGLNRYLDSPGFVRGVAGGLLLGILVGLMLLSKRNYFAFLALLPALLAVRRLGICAALLLATAGLLGSAVFFDWIRVPEGQRAPWVAAGVFAWLVAVFAPRATRGERGRVAAKIAALGLVAVALVLPRLAWDQLANESTEKKREVMGTLQEQIAKPGYKPSEVYSVKPQPGSVFHGLDMRARGIPLEALFQPPWNWHVRTFSSFTGQYGWLDILAPLPYYITIALGYVLLAAAFSQALVRSRSAIAWGTLAVGAATAALTIAISVHHSWNNDFQAQGRYLFPILAIAGAAFLAVRQQLATRLFAAAVAACFLLSAWSFVFVGLWQIPKAF